MKVEKVTIERRQIVFSDREFSDINNVRNHLENALQFTQDHELQQAVNALEAVLKNINIQEDGNYYFLEEETWRDDA